MTVSTPSFAAVQSARRFIGRRATACRKHGDPDQQHHVNRMGGLVCSECYPPRTNADCVLKLVICGGLWDDAENPFDYHGGDEEGHGPGAATSPDTKNQNATAAQPSATNFYEATTSELVTPRDHAEQRTSRRVGEPLLDLELDLYFGLPTGDLPTVVSARMIGREPTDKESQEERKRAGLLDLSVQKSGFVGGTVRRGEGFGLSVDPPHNNALANAPTKPQFAVGQVVRLLRRLETFRGFLQPRGGFVVSSIGRDFDGCPLVALSLGGEVVVSGLVPDEQTIQPELDPVSIEDLIG